MVDLEKAELIVLAETSKGRRWRMLPLVPELVAVLQEWRQSCPDEERVLSWQDSTSFGRDDLPLVAKVADMAHTWIFQKTQVQNGSAREHNGASQHEAEQDL